MFFYSLIRSGASLPEIFIYLIALLLAASIGIIVHEISHGYAALKCGDYTAKASGRLNVNPKNHFDPLGFLMMLLVGFGWAKPVPINPNNFKDYKKGMFFVSIAGVAANLALCAFGLLLLFLFGFMPVATGNAFLYSLQLFAAIFLQLFIRINFMLAFFNLLPIYPLDGFRLLDSFLPFGNAFSRFMRRYGSYCLIGLILLSNLFDVLNLHFLDIFYWANRLIQLLMGTVT